MAGLLTAHFLGDFTHASTPRMLAAKRHGMPLLPIAEHAWLHANLVIFVCGCCSPLLPYNFDVMLSRFLACFGLEFVSHLLLDVFKGRLAYWFPRTGEPACKRYWYVFGLDQLAHQLVLVGINVILWWP